MFMISFNVTVSLSANFQRIFSKSVIAKVTVYVPASLALKGYSLFALGVPAVRRSSLVVVLS